MLVVVHILAAGALAVAITIVFNARRAVRGTTLVAAWRCAAVGMVAWSIAWVLSALRIAPPAVLDQLWYGVGVLMLCPLVAVLGARRPVSRVWPWFVLLPMVLVLGLPAMTAWTRDFEVIPLELEAPPVIGFLLVLVMGAGNYIGTRYSFAALTYAAAVASIIVPLALSDNGHLPDALLWSFSTIFLGLSVMIAFLASLRFPMVSTSFDVLWYSFRDTFGIVWARRIQERLNQIAVKEQWPVRVTMNGIRPVQEGEVLPEDRGKIEHAFRWLLRRFVDPAWIDARLIERNPAAEDPLPTDKE